MDAPQPRGFSRILLPAAALHAFATVVAFFALLNLTSAGGEGYPDSPAIGMIAGVLKGLAMPAAWPVERFLDPSRHHPPAFGVLVALRLMNSLLVGALVAWIWTSARRRDPAQIKR